MEENKLLKLMDIFSYGRYVLPNSRNDTSYIYPVIMPLEGCYKQKPAVRKEFFRQPIYPLLEKNDRIQYEVKEILANLAVGTHGLTKYEIDSPYKFHRPVPSARGIHPCELYFFSQNGVKRYNPVDNFFDLLWEGGEETGDFSIVIAADDWRLAKFYGDFAYVLGALDAGHIIGQLTVLATKMGCFTEIIYSKAQDVNGNNTGTYFDKQGLVVYASILVKKENAKTEALTDYQMRGRRKLSYTDKTKQLLYRKELVQLKHMEQVCKQSDRQLIPCKEPAETQNIARQTIGEILIKRTSAHSHVGLVSVGHMDAINRKLSWIAKELKEYMQKANLLPYVNIYLFLNEESAEYAKGYYRLNRKESDWELVKSTENTREEWFRIIHDSHEFLNVQGIPFVFFTSVHIHELMNKYEDRVIDAMYMYSGEIGQIISLLVTGYGMFCRPIKNICEEKLEQFLMLQQNKERITYAMLVGKENITQQSLYMDCWGREEVENE